VAGRGLQHRKRQQGPSVQPGRGRDADLVALGVAEKPDLFAQFVVVERDPNNATRLNASLPHHKGCDHVS
jgi:hypothetical protein